MRRSFCHCGTNRGNSDAHANADVVNDTNRYGDANGNTKPRNSDAHSNGHAVNVADSPTDGDRDTDSDTRPNAHANALADSTRWKRLSRNVGGGPIRM